MKDLTNYLLSDRVRRFWWLIILLLLLGIFMCLFVTPAGATFIALLFPTPTETATAEPTEVIESKAEPTKVKTEPPTETEEPTEPPTEPPTNTPTNTVVPVSETDEPTETEPACVVTPGDGICSACENTDLDSASCVCTINGVCEAGEGLNCPDCGPTAVPCTCVLACRTCTNYVCQETGAACMP